MAAPLTPQHVGSRRTGYVRPHTGAELSRMVGDPDAVFAGNLRDGVPLKERQADNLRRFRQANPANDRFAGPPRHYRIGPAPHPVTMTALDVIACLLVAFAIGFMLAAGGAF